MAAAVTGFPFADSVPGTEADREHDQKGNSQIHLDKHPARQVCSNALSQTRPVFDNFCVLKGQRRNRTRTSDCNIFIE